MYLIIIIRSVTSMYLHWYNKVHQNILQLSAIQHNTIGAQSQGRSEGRGAKGARNSNVLGTNTRKLPNHGHQKLAKGGGAHEHRGRHEHNLILPRPPFFSVRGPAPSLELNTVHYNTAYHNNRIG